MLGLSLGESAGLFGMRIWTDRDEMFRRIRASTLSDRTWPAVRRGPPALEPRFRRLGLGPALGLGRRRETRAYRPH